jgi:methionyl-tRNA formyltransferase
LIISKARVAAKDSSIPQSDFNEGHPSGLILTPGDITRLVVAGGDQSAVEILELQPAGKRRMLTPEFLRGYRFHSGDRFGQGPN